MGSQFILIAQSYLIKRVKPSTIVKPNKLRIMRVKYLKKSIGEKVNIDNFPNFSANGSIRGMKKLYYGMDALLVKCGSYIYNVSSEPSIYHDLAY